MDALDSVMDELESSFVRGGRLAAFQSRLGCIREQAENVVALDTNLVGVVVGHHHHVFRVDLADDAHVTAERREVATASDMQTVGALGTTV